MPAEVVFRLTRRRFVAVWAALAVVLMAVLSLVVGLAVNAVPKWNWTHNWWLLIAVSAVLLGLTVLVAVVQARSSPGGENKDGPVAPTGLRTADPGNGLLTLVVQHQGAGEKEPGGYRLPARNPGFTGREETLEEVGRLLADGPVAVRGLGGIGKTQVALEYAHRMRAASRYQVAGWVRADSAVTMAADLAAMAPLLGLRAGGLTGEVAEAVVAALGSRQDWLLVFDNARAPSDVAGMLLGGGGHVLITSRNRAWSGGASPLDLTEFSLSEAVEFLSKRARRAEPAAAEKLAGELGRLPLALAAAADYIDAQQSTISDYLALYLDPEQSRILRDYGLESSEYPASVARTWVLAFQQLSDYCPAAVELLQLCAFLDPDDIDLKLLSAHAALSDSPIDPAGALARVSLVSRPEQSRLRIHRLVQAVTRDRLDAGQAAAWIARALDLVSAAFPGEPQDYSSWPDCASLAPHAVTVAAHAKRHPGLAAQAGALLDRLGSYLATSAQFSAARTTLEEALAMKETACGPSHPEVAITLTQLGSLHERLDELPVARTMLERALDILRAAAGYGPGHPDVAKALDVLSVVQRKQQDRPEALATAQSALDVKEAAYGLNHPEVARTLIILSVVQRLLGMLSEARSSVERALAIFQATYGPDHPEVGIALTKLGLVQQELDELPAARASLERALVIFETAYGADHPEVANALSNLSFGQQLQGELPVAQATLERALAIYRACYGPDHRDVVRALSELDDIWQQMNRRHGLTRAGSRRKRA